MDFIKIIAIFSVFIITQIEMIPVLSTSSVELSSPAKINKTVLKVPKNIKPGTDITILGNNNNVSTFNVTFSGDHMDKHDKCEIFFTPTQDRKQLIIKFNNQNKTNETTYDIDAQNRGVSFTLHVFARATDEGDTIDLHFEETNGGLEPLGDCRFTSFKSLEYIVFEGVEHVKNLCFNFERPDY